MVKGEVVGKKKRERKKGKEKIRRSATEIEEVRVEFQTPR
jgi:hypothetical protein